MKWKALFSLIFMPFADATQAARNSHDENANRPYKLVAELRNIQSVCNRAIHSPKCKPSEIASLTRAYVEAGKLILVHQGKPANTSQSIRSDPVKKSKPQAAPMEWIEPEPTRVGPAVHPTDAMPEGVTDARSTAKPV